MKSEKYLEYKLKRIGFFTILVLIISLFFWQPVYGQQKKAVNASQNESDSIGSFQKGSLAWQLDEFMKWVMKTRNLVPREKVDQEPYYVIESLVISGSVAQNRFSFSMTGSVVSDSPLLVPLFGYPHQVILKNIMIDNEPAVTGFSGMDYYYVSTGKKHFTIRGEMSLRNEMSFFVPGPVNFFTADLTDGRIVEGNVLPALEQTVIHLESGKKEEKAELNLPPLFQVSRAIRIRKEITFEYQVHVRSGSEISSVTLPVKNNEIILEIPGINGWKQSNGELIVPVSGRDIIFSVQGRLPKIGTFEPDPRSSYEWWLIESDMEHRVYVKTSGKQVDSSESPIPKKLTSPKLYLLTKGQNLNIQINALTAMEALAVVIPSQYRTIVWTREGEMVAMDEIRYRNNGLDYIPFDCKGKPLYFEIDGQANKILSENSTDKTRVLIPLQKGEHQVRVQSIIKGFKPGLFGGIMRIPVPSHELTISQDSIELRLPSSIIPLWFTGGEGIRSPIGFGDAFAILISLVLALIVFKEIRPRLALFIALCGFYFIIPALFIGFLVLLVVIIIIKLIWYFLAGWKRWVALVIGALAIIISVGVSFEYLNRYELHGGMTFQKDQSDAYDSGTSYDRPPGKFRTETEADEEQIGQRAMPAQMNEPADKLGNVFFNGKNVVEGVTPVELPMPGYDYALSVSRELVTVDRPLSPSLIYITRSILIPFVLIWIFCLIYTAIVLTPKMKSQLVKIKEFSSKVSSGKGKE